MPRPEVLVVAPLMPFLMEALRRDYTVHDRIHMSDPAALAAAAPRIRAVVANGEAKVPRELIAQLPALEIIGCSASATTASTWRRRTSAACRSPTRPRC